MLRNHQLFLARFFLGAAILSLHLAAFARDGVSITVEDGTLRVEIDGELFTKYHYKNVERPYFYPVIGPDGARMTRDYPMKENPDDAKDHPHHTSLWYAHGAINGHDFWHKAKTVHVEFLEVRPGKEVGIIKSKNNLVANNGEVVATDVRTVRIYADRSKGTLMDFDISVQASEGKVVMGDTKEGSMAIRLAPTLRLEGKVGQGHIVNSAGQKDGNTWGKRAKWVDYYGPIDGKTVGVAIFDHPSNPRHPTWWHVRPYGLFAANPFGVHDFENKPEGTGDLTIPEGKEETWRYRFYFHPGDAKEADVEGRYENYAAED